VTRGMGGRTSLGRTAHAVHVARLAPRRRVLSPSRLLSLVLLALLAAGLCCAGPAAAKSYQIGDVSIVADVRPSGDVLVTEQRSFRFDGRFHFVYWDLSMKGSDGIKVLGVDGPDGPLERIDSGDQGYTVRRSGRTVKVTAYWPMSAADTFTLRYLARGAAKRYRDTAELYWQFVGRGWGVPTRRISVVVELPGDVSKSQVRAWGHGPLNGSVRIKQDGTVVYAVERVPAETSVEGRVLFPAAALSKAPVVEIDRMAAAMAAEKK
jgi:uncharacterized membrane protein